MEPIVVDSFCIVFVFVNKYLLNLVEKRVCSFSFSFFLTSPGTTWLLSNSPKINCQRLLRYLTWIEKIVVPKKK